MVCRFKMDDIRFTKIPSIYITDFYKRKQFFNKKLSTIAFKTKMLIISEIERTTEAMVKNGEDSCLYTTTVKKIFTKNSILGLAKRRDRFDLMVEEFKNDKEIEILKDTETHITFRFSNSYIENYKKAKKQKLENEINSKKDDKCAPFFNYDFRFFTRMKSINVILFESMLQFFSSVDGSASYELFYLFKLFDVKYDINGKDRKKVTQARKNGIKQIKQIFNECPSMRQFDYYSPKSQKEALYNKNYKMKMSVYSTAERLDEIKEVLSGINNSTGLSKVKTKEGVKINRAIFVLNVKKNPIETLDLSLNAKNEDKSGLHLFLSAEDIDSFCSSSGKKEKMKFNASKVKETISDFGMKQDLNNYISK